eukprot:5441371-Prymnesium_polylepis.1
MWQRLVNEPDVWHAPSCVSEHVVTRLLALANISRPTATSAPAGAAVIHRIAAQDDPAVAHVRRQMAQRAGLPTNRAEPLLLSTDDELHRRA